MRTLEIYIEIGWYVYLHALVGVFLIQSLALSGDSHGTGRGRAQSCCALGNLEVFYRSWHPVPASPRQYSDISRGSPRTRWGLGQHLRVL